MTSATTTLPCLLAGIDAGLLVLDAGQRVLYWNRWLESHSGVPAQRVLGHTLTALFPTGAVSEALCQAIEECARHGRSRMLSRSLHPGGLPLYAAGSGSAAGGVLLDQSIMVRALRAETGDRLCLVQVFDASATVARERALRRIAREKEQQARHLQAILDSSIDGIIQVDEAGRILSANPSARAMFGFADAEMIGLRFFDRVALGPEEAGDGEGAMKALLGHRREVSGVHRRGMLFPIEITVTHVEHPGVSSYCAVISDITERKRAAQALDSSYQAMKRQAEDLSSLAEHLEFARSQQEHMRLRAERDSHRSTDFLALVGHELKTPLNAILGFAEILEAQLGELADGGVLLGYAGHIKKSGSHLLGLINDILDLARVESGNVALQRDWIDAPRLVHACLAQVDVKAQARGVRLSSTIPQGLPWLYADERLVRQMLAHLLSNAVKFTQEGGSVWIAVMHKEGAPEELVFSVTDTGIGMSPREIDHAMQPFSQVSDIMTRHDEGLGLGLPLVKALAELHNGRLIIASTPNRGTTATIHFPLTEQAARADPRRPVAARRAGAPVGAAQGTSEP